MVRPETFGPYHVHCFFEGKGDTFHRNSQAASHPRRTEFSIIQCLNPRNHTLHIFAFLHPNSLAVNIQCGHRPYFFMYSFLRTSTCPTSAGCCSWTPTRPWSSSSPTSTFLSTASSWWLSHKVTTSSCWPKCTVLAPHFHCRHTVLVTGLLVATSPGPLKASTGEETTYRDTPFMPLK